MNYPWVVALTIAMNKWKFMFLNARECKSLISNATEFLTSCQWGQMRKCVWWLCLQFILFHWYKWSTFIETRNIVLDVRCFRITSFVCLSKQEKLSNIYIKFWIILTNLIYYFLSSVSHMFNCCWSEDAWLLDFLCNGIPTWIKFRLCERHWRVIIKRDSQARTMVCGTVRPYIFFTFNAYSNPS
jgi:hypothetical protein